MSDTDRKLAVFPAFHKVEGRRVVVVGGGHEAAAKIRLLSETKAEIVVYRAGARQGDRRRPDRRPCRLARRPGRASPISPAPRWSSPRPASEEGDREIWALAKEAGVPVNVVDRPELCDFYTPAIVNRAPLAVAVAAKAWRRCCRVTSARASRRCSRRPSATSPGLPSGSATACAQALAVGAERRRFWARFFSGAVAEKVFAGRARRRRGARRSRIARDRPEPSPAMSRWSAPVPAPRIC